MRDAASITMAVGGRRLRWLWGAASGSNVRRIYGSLLSLHLFVPSVVATAQGRGSTSRLSDPPASS